MTVEEIKRNFTINHNLLSEFKKESEKASKSYKRTIQEAIELWLKKQRN